MLTDVSEETIFDVFSFMNGNELPKIRHVSSWWNECIAKNQNLLPRQLIDKLVKLSGNGISCFGEGPRYNETVLYRNCCMERLLFFINTFIDFNKIETIAKQIGGKFVTKLLELYVSNGETFMKNISVITKFFDFENLYINDFEIASIYIIQHPEILHIPWAKSISLGGNIENGLPTTTNELLNFIFDSGSFPNREFCRLRLPLDTCHDFIEKLLAHFPLACFPEKALKEVEFFVQYETVLYWNDSLERAGLTNIIPVIDNPYNGWEFYDLNKDEWTLRIMHSSGDRYFWKIRVLNRNNSY